MNILFITNYSKKYGGGHLNRCCKLSKKIGKKNKIIFLVDVKDKNIFDLIPKNSTVIASKKIFNDVRKTTELIKKIQNPIVIIDSYMSNLNIERKIYPHCKKLIIIDDLKKKHYCDVYINPNFLNFKFATKIKAKKKLLGTKFSFLDLNKNKIVDNKKKLNKKKNVLIFMGTTDSRNLSTKIYNAIRSDKFKNLKLSFIKGYNNKNLDKIIKKNKLKNVKFLDFSKRFSNYLNKTDLFISSGGSSVWEAIFLKKKILIFNHSQKQVENSTNLEKKGFVKQFKGKLKTGNISKFLLNEIRLFNKNIYNHKNLLDSKGIERVVKEIL